MSQEQEDLEFNKYYQILKTKFWQTYNNAQKNCYTICIPVSQSLKTCENVKQDFVDVHILQPSPFFKGQYLTTEKDRRALVLENNMFTLKDGFKVKDQIKVISEELGYNKELKPFRFLWIARPFIPVSSVKSTEEITQETEDVFSLEPTYEGCQEYLRKFPECNQALEIINREIQQLHDNYMILKGFLTEVSEKVKSIWKDLCEVYLARIKPSEATDSRVKNNTEKSIESCLLGRLHVKLFPVIREECIREDEGHQEKLSLLKGLPPEVLGVCTEYCFPLPQAIREISRLSLYRTPLDMLVCLKQTLDNITQSVNEHHRDNHKHGDFPMLSTDDYIPLLLYVLAQAEKLPLASIEYYIDHYHWTSSHTDNLSYSYVTFQAVIKYLSTLDAQRLVSQHQTSKVAAEATKSSVSVPEPCRVPVTRRTRRDRRIDRITSMLERSTNDFMDASKESLPPRLAGAASTRPNQVLQRNKQAASLGSFLSSLSDDSAPSFGKQT